MNATEVYYGFLNAAPARHVVGVDEDEGEEADVALLHPSSAASPPLLPLRRRVDGSGCCRLRAALDVRSFTSSLAVDT